MTIRTAVTSLFVAFCLTLATEASAQGFGIGPHWSFIRGDVATGTPSTRSFGGSIRMASSKRVALEASLDTRTEVSADGTARLRERPLQGSMLIFPVRSTFSPYLLGGYGIYTRTTEALSSTGSVTASEVERKTGAHMGFGAELLLGKHAALYMDYRFRFVKFGAPDEGSTALNVPGSSLIPGGDSLKLSHQGTMWTSGVAFYF